MYDFFKLDISYLDVDTLEKHPLLEWCSLVNKHGEIIPLFIDEYESRKFKPDRVAKYHGLYFEQYHRIEKIYIRGSLHKFKNEGKHNADDYSLNIHRGTVERLKELFGVIPCKTRIHHVEVSTIVKLTDYTVKDIYKNILFHSSAGGPTKQYNTVEMPNSLYKQAKRTQYIIKLYAKHLQYKLSNELLRFEIKYFKMERLNKLGFKYLSHSTEPHYCQMLQEELLQRWNESVLYDWTIRKMELSTEQIIDLKDYRNNLYWTELTSEQRRRAKKKYFEIVENHSDQIAKDVAYKIEQKTHRLTISDESIKNHRLTNNIVSTTANSRIYPDEIYTLHPQHPKRKKLRNDKSNAPNNFKRKLQRTKEEIKQGLFPEFQINLNDTQKNLMNYFR